MVKTTDLESFINHYLRSEQIEDASLNGLQVQGTESIQRIVLGVSANIALFKKAQSLQAQAVIVHHGLFWEKMDFRMRGVLGQRVALLMKYDLNLMAYHLPLDLHPQIGNNISLLQLLPVETVQPFGVYHHIPIGFQGTLKEAITLAEIQAILEKSLQGSVLKSYNFGPTTISRIGVVSGGAPEILRQAIDLRLDLFITGEVAEYSQELCHEGKINYLAMGHYTSEKLGIINLGKKISEVLGCETEFIDIPNPV